MNGSLVQNARKGDGIWKKGGSRFEKKKDKSSSLLTSGSKADHARRMDAQDEAKGEGGGRAEKRRRRPRGKKVCWLKKKKTVLKDGRRFSEIRAIPRVIPKGQVKRGGRK